MCHRSGLNRTSKKCRTPPPKNSFPHSPTWNSKSGSIPSRKKEDGLPYTFRSYTVSLCESNFLKNSKYTLRFLTLHLFPPTEYLTLYLPIVNYIYQLSWRLNLEKGHAGKKFAEVLICLTCLIYHCLTFIYIYTIYKKQNKTKKTLQKVVIPLYPFHILLP